jgi:hypothetical protein
MAHSPYMSYALTHEGMVNSFLIDCSELWKNPDDRNRVASCNPEHK